jgi:hypothetical protein
MVSLFDGYSAIEQIDYYQAARKFNPAIEPPNNQTN